MDNMKIVRSLDAVCESNKDGSALITATMEKINARNSYDLQRMYDALLANNEVVSKLVAFLTDKKNEDVKPSHSKHNTVEEVPDPYISVEENHVASGLANNRIQQNDSNVYTFKEYSVESHQDSTTKDNIYNHPNFHQAKNNIQVKQSQSQPTSNSFSKQVSVPVQRSSQATSLSKNNNQNSTSRFNMNKFSVALLTTPDDLQLPKKRETNLLVMANWMKSWDIIILTMKKKKWLSFMSMIIYYFRMM